MRLRTCLFTLSLAIAVPPSARADAPSSQASQAADPDTSFRLGREAMAKSDWQRALDLLRESHRASPGRGKLANIAICESRLGLVGSATRHIEELLRELPANDERVPALAKEAQRIAPKVPRLRIQLAPGAPPGTGVTLDGEAIPEATLGEEIPADPGAHVLIARVGGGHEKRFEVTLPEGGRHTVLVAPDAAPSVGGPRSTGWKVGIAALSAGGASLVVGAVTGALFLSKNSALVKQCPNDVCPKGFDLDSALGARTALGTASTVTLIAGGVLAAGGAVLVATAKSGEARGALWVMPSVGGGMVGVGGRF